MFSVCGMISIIICSKPKISTDYSRFIQYAYIENIDGNLAGKTHQSHVYKCRNLFYSCNMEEMYLLLWYILKDNQMKRNRFELVDKLFWWLRFLFVTRKFQNRMLNFIFLTRKTENIDIEFLIFC